MRKDLAALEIENFVPGGTQRDREANKKGEDGLGRLLRPRPPRGYRAGVVVVSPALGVIGPLACDEGGQAGADEGPVDERDEGGGRGGGVAVGAGAASAVGAEADGDPVALGVD